MDRIAYVLGDAGATLLPAHAATLSKAPRGVDVLDLEQAELYSGPDADPEPAKRSFPTWRTSSIPPVPPASPRG